MLTVRVEVITFDFPPGAEVALRAELPARVIRSLTLRRNDRAESETETGGRTQRRAGRLDECPIRNRIAHIGEKCCAVVVGGNDRRRLRKAGLVAGVEIVVVAEETSAAANHRLVSDEIGKRGA